MPQPNSTFRIPHSTLETDSSVSQMALAALVIEFDVLFLGGFAVASEVLAERLAKYGVADDDPYRFVRQVYGKPLTAALTALLPPSVDVAHVERRLAATYSAVLQQSAQEAISRIRSTLKPFLRAGHRIALITRLRPAIIEELFEKESAAIEIIADTAPLAAGVTPEVLQSALVALGTPSRLCLALLSCGASVRSAMRIGLRAMAIIDPMVSFENCAGADGISDTFDKAFTAKVKARLEQLSTK